ncbi:MAG: polymerase [Devosia sp.]|nr:polymerase [Devosia sp.]
MPDPLTDSEALALLDWYRAVGVDLAVEDAPIDRFAASRAVPARPSPAAVEQAPLPGLVADSGEATALAASATSLAALEQIMGAYDGCALKLRATQLVFADGNPEADVMLVGEAPGAEEDLQGKPFVGRAGQLLDRMLAAIGLNRTSVYIANAVPWRPPGNRDPTPQEIAACAPFLARQIELVGPKVLLTLGNVPTKALFEVTTGITRMRGQTKALQFGSLAVTGLATFHPSFLLRNPPAKALVWRDLLKLRELLRNPPPQPN